MLGSRDRNDLAAQLAEARARVSELESELSRMSSRDPITSDLLTLRTFRTQLEVDIQRAQRYSRPLAVALVDIDRFRLLNLKHGYGVGDLVLGAVGGAITAATRAHDLASRIGGDEFAILFSETDSGGALEALARILVSLDGLEAGGVRGLSASAGVATLEPGQGAEELLAAAGSALEQARAAGGGQAMLYSPSSEGEADDPGELTGGRGDVIAALAQALGERDRHGTSEHSESVVELVERIGESMALDPDRIGRLRTATLLRDIGKIGISDEIIHKPGPLDEHEWELIRGHPLIGERIIRASSGLGAVARIVRHRHERWDGTGYPDGIGGEQIPLEARIILACDAYHAMTAERPYRKSLEHGEALAELSANAGSQFDPRVIEAMLGYLRERRQAGLAAV